MRMQLLAFLSGTLHILLFISTYCANKWWWYPCGSILMMLVTFEAILIQHELNFSEWLWISEQQSNSNNWITRDTRHYTKEDNLHVLILRASCMKNADAWDPINSRTAAVHLIAEGPRDALGQWNLVNFILNICRMSSNDIINSPTS